MWCPRCANENTKVIGTVKGSINERSRKCPECGYTFMTIEALKTDKYWSEYAKHLFYTEADTDSKNSFGIKDDVYDDIYR